MYIFLGHCEFNKLQIFAKPNNYTLRFYVDNIENEIELKFDDIEISVSDCETNQIKMYNNNGIIYCVNPICKNCPVGESATCIQYYTELINDIEKNICQCLPGYEGNNCKDKKFINFR